MSLAKIMEAFASTMRPPIVQHLEQGRRSGAKGTDNEKALAEDAAFLLDVVDKLEADRRTLQGELTKREERITELEKENKYLRETQ